MSIPTSMGGKKLEVRKGDRNTLVDFTGQLGSGVLIDAGSVCSINPLTGKLRAGLDAADALNQLPLFAWSGTDVNNAPDVVRDGLLSGALNAQTRSNITGGNGYAMPYAGEARFGTIAGKSAVELSTTAFDSSKSYAPGQPLTCVATGNANAGVIRDLATPATDIIIGRVAPAGKFTGPDGYATLAFYPGLELLRAGNTLPTSL